MLGLINVGRVYGALDGHRAVFAFGAFGIEFYCAAGRYQHLIAPQADIAAVGSDIPFGIRSCLSSLFHAKVGTQLARSSEITAIGFNVRPDDVGTIHTAGVGNPRLSHALGLFFIRQLANI